MIALFSASYRIVFRWAVLLPAIVSVACQASLAQTPTAPQEAFLQLANGGEIRGKLTLSGDHYRVDQEQGKRVFVRTRDVVALGSSWEDLYELQRRSIDGRSVGDHLRLADWCLEHDLIELAASELLAARALEPQHPRVALCERRLEFALSQHSAPEPTTPTTPQPPPPHQPAEANVASTAPPLEVTPEALEAFTTTIQPLLLNTCTASGCHQSNSHGKESFRLNRGALWRDAGRRSTLANLTATLAQIDRDDPLMSPLLRETLRAHGGMDHPPLPLRKLDHYRKLESWVELVLGSPEAGDQQAPTQELESQAQAAEVQLANLHAGMSDGKADLDFELFPRGRIRYGARLRRVSPKPKPVENTDDPFDPDEFNQRTPSPKSPPPRSSAQAKAQAKAQRATERSGD